MDQRIYYGNINPNALADYLVGVFHQPPMYYQAQHTVAQKIMQGERIYVQIMRTGDWSGSGQRTIGVHITRIAGGVSVEMGASDWMDLNEAGLASMLLGALFFPPLLLFPLIQGLSSSGFSQDVWGAIDSYCMQVSGARNRQAHATQGFYCTYCGAFNHPGSPRCHFCHAPFRAEQPPQPQAGPVPGAPVEPEREPQPEASTPQKTGETRPMFALMICPNCKATVVPAHFCGNCAAPLPDVGEEANADE